MNRIIPLFCLAILQQNQCKMMCTTYISRSCLYCWSWQSQQTTMFTNSTKAFLLIRCNSLFQKAAAGLLCSRWTFSGIKCPEPWSFDQHNVLTCTISPLLQHHRHLNFDMKLAMWPNVEQTVGTDNKSWNRDDPATRIVECCDEVMYQWFRMAKVILDNNWSGQTAHISDTDVELSQLCYKTRSTELQIKTT